MDQIGRKLKATGLKATGPRRAVLAAFYEHSEPMSAERIYDIVKDADIDMATIYRSLASFEVSELIRKVDLRQGVHCYERTDTHHHHHITCRDCGKTEDFEMCVVDDVARKALRHSSFARVDSHSLELFGQCKKCAK